MSLAPLFHAAQETDLATALRESELMYPIVLSLHLAAIAFFGGTILMTDLRLLGLAMRNTPAAEVIRQLRASKRIGFIVMVGCGLLLAASKADNYYANPYFRTKMTLLALVGVHALVFRRSVYGNPERLDQAAAMPAAAKVAACLSLALWLGIMSAGRWIAYYEPRTLPQVATTRPSTSLSRLERRRGAADPRRVGPPSPDVRAKALWPPENVTVPASAGLEPSLAR